MNWKWQSYRSLRSMWDFDESRVEMLQMFNELIPNGNSWHVFNAVCSINLYSTGSRSPSKDSSDKSPSRLSRSPSKHSGDRDTLHENKSYSRRERSRSRERSHRDRGRRRSTSRHRDRSRERERDRGSRHYGDSSSHREINRERRDRSRSKKLVDYWLPDNLHFMDAICAYIEKQNKLRQTHNIL